MSQIERLRLIQIALIFTLLVPTLSRAQGVEVLKVNKGKEPTSTSWTGESQWVWKKSKKSKAPLFYNMSRIKPESGLGPLKVKAKNGKAQYSGSKKQLVILSRSARNQVAVKSSKGVGRYLIKQNGSGVINTEGCDSTTIVLEPKGEEIPLPIGIHCEVKDAKTFLTIALPVEGEWINSTLFEVDGKGESWKLYEISTAQARSGAMIGDFQFLFEDKTYDYSLKSSFVAQEKTAQSLENNQYHIVAGTSEVKASTNGYSGSVSAFVFGGRLLTRPLLWGIRAGLDLNIHQSFSDGGDDDISYQEFRAYASYRIFDGSAFQIAPRFYGIFADSGTSGTGLNMVHQQMGYGLALILGLGDSMDLSATYISSGFAASEDVTHTSIQAAMDFKLGKLSYGVGMEMNVFEFKLEDNTTPKFEQTLMMLRVGF